MKKMHLKKKKRDLWSMKQNMWRVKKYRCLDQARRSADVDTRL